MSLEQDCLASAHKREEGSASRPYKTQPILGGPEVIQEPPQDAEVTGVGEIPGVSEVVEPPQIDPTLA